MSLEDGIIALAEAVGADVKALNVKIGDLSQLSTAAKDNLVAAINEAAKSGVDIDDNAGTGDTDVTWSADKSARELADKVDKVEGYSLVDDDEIAKLATVQENATANRDDSENADKIHEHDPSQITGKLGRGNLSDSFDYVDYISSGSLNQQDWKCGTYLVAASVLNRPSGFQNQNAIFEVRKSGSFNYEILTGTLYPYKSFKRVCRFSRSEFGSWQEVRFNISEIPKTDRAGLSDYFLYNEFITSGSLNQQKFKDGTFIFSGSVNDKPKGLSGGNFFLRVENYGNWQQQTVVHSTLVSQRFTRIVRFSALEFGEWIPVGEVGGGNSNRLLSKNIVFMGDSITANPAGLIYYFNIMTGANVIACGIGGTRMGVHTNPDYNEFSGHKLALAIKNNDFAAAEAAAISIGGSGNIDQIQKIKMIDWSTVDYLVVGYGTNDFGGDRVPGVVSDTDESTFSGASKLFIDRIHSVYPHVKMLFWTPIWRGKTPTHIDGVDGGSDVSPNSNGFYLRDFGDALHAVCKLRHQECLDLYDTSGIYQATSITYLADMLHPNSKGSEMLAGKIVGALNSRF